MWGLKQARFPERDAPLAPHHHVVEQAQPDEVRGRSQTARELPVFARRGRISRRVVVVHDERGGVREKRALQELARLDDGAVERAAIDLGIVPQETVPRVQVERAGPLLGPVAAGAPQVVDYQPSFVDGIGGKSVFPQMFERARGLIDGALVASLAEVAAALALMAERNRVIAEGAGACALACALAGKAGSGRMVCVVSGGNIDFSRFCAVLAANT